MACHEVGDTNSDIAGLGIVVAFAFQAGLSLILSIWSLLFWKSAIMSLFDLEMGVGLNAARFSPLQFYYDLARFTNALARQLHQDSSLPTPIQRAVASFSQVLRQYGDLFDPDGSGLQRVVSGIYRGDEVARGLQKKCIDRILSTISDIQIVNAIALLIAALIQNTSLSLYHMHIVYDTVSFTGVSVCASLVNVLGQEHRMKKRRWISLSVLALTYLAYTIFFGVRLMKWDDNKPGYCYNTHLVSASISPHPQVDQAYVAITCLYFLAAIGACLQYQESATGSGVVTAADMPPEHVAPMVVGLAMLQYPLHLYFVVALRASNESLLTGDSENSWGFGQIVALVLSAASLLECIKGVSEYKEIGARRRKIEEDTERVTELRDNDGPPRRRANSLP